MCVCGGGGGDEEGVVLVQCPSFEYVRENRAVLSCPGVDPNKEMHTPSKHGA